ncbi:hypothetical protein CEXT_53931 [Caerostris extrusa]|uniref:Uncharacterized protein n=1 Tax=Caerostris extrusa TaxID=172846 RepID=A0AAV4TRJ7_CAEEX|nr:hypothetical protein CEXT_53931 [Caerostris extrusa]
MAATDGNQETNLLKKDTFKLMASLENIECEKETLTDNKEYINISPHKLSKTGDEHNSKVLKKSKISTINNSGAEKSTTSKIKKTCSKIN